MRTRLVEYALIVAPAVFLGGAIATQSWWWTAGLSIVLAVVGLAYIFNEGDLK